MLSNGIMRLAVCCASALTLAAGELTREGGLWVDTDSGVVSLSGVERVRVLAVGGVRVVGRPSETGEFRLIRRAAAADEASARRSLDAFRVRTERAGTVLTVLVQAEGDWTVAPRLELNLPRRIGLTSVETRSGGVAVEGMGGDVLAETSGGNIEAGVIGGSLMARTGGGRVQVESVGGRVRCITGGGPIWVGRAGGDAWLESAGGEIRMGQAGGRLHAATGAGNVEVVRALSGVEARTAGGVIRVRESGGMVEADTSGGAIEVGSARGVRCHSAAGAIRLYNVTGRVDAGTAAGPLQVELVRGQRLGDSSLQTASGDVVVTIPSNLAVTVQAWNQSPWIAGRIVSQFAEVQVSSGGALLVRPVSARGLLNGGGPVLNIATTRGTIFLRRKN